MGYEDTQIVLIFIGAAGVVVVMASLIALFVVLYQKRMLAQQQLVQQLHSDHQVELLRATIEGQERERKRLAKDLHDGIGSLLTGLKLNMQHQLQLASESSPQREFLSEACLMLENNIAEVRRVSHNLLPATLESFGLEHALRECIEPLQQQQRSIELQTRGRVERLPPEVELGALRVVQELLQNTTRHAQASRIHIELHFAPTVLELRYRDNGVGLEATASANGLGFKNMESRLRTLSGKLEYHSPGGQGFEATATIPLNDTL